MINIFLVFIIFFNCSEVLFCPEHRGSGSDTNDLLNRVMGQSNTPKRMKTELLGELTKIDKYLKEINENRSLTPEQKTSLLEKMDVTKNEIINEITRGPISNAIILAITGNNRDISTISGSIVYRCFKPLTKTLDKFGELFWDKIFEVLQNKAHRGLIALGFAPKISSEEIELLASLADNIKSQLELQAKSSDNVFSSEKAMNIRLSEEDQYNFDQNQKYKHKDLESFLDLTNLALFELEKYIKKFKVNNSSEKLILQIIKKRFLELKNIFITAGSMKELASSSLLSSAKSSCIIISTMCNQDLKSLCLSQPRVKKSNHYSFAGENSFDKF